ncbi:hypothetical protein HZB93_04610 [Candidatus Falkowbacteria bacterium]|nr:hypothetical protein [Candidatus Falkowbacteria bacterium]
MFEFFSPKRKVLVAILVLAALTGALAFGLFGFAKPAEAVKGGTIAKAIGWVGAGALAVWGGVEIAEGISNAIAAFDTIMVNLLAGFAKLLGKLFTWVVGMLVDVAAYNSFLQATAVVTGWVIVRDVANMFFVLILLIISIATILRVEAYSYKKLLPKLLLMAVLINFSKTICGIIIDFAQVIMLTFVNAFQAAAGANFFQALGINQLFSFDNLAEGTAAAGQQWDLVGTALLAMIVVLVATITVGVLMVVLVARVVVLWTLIVLSPLAYLLASFPQGQTYAKQWWDEFTKNVITGPILAFFIWLSLIVAGGGNAGAELGIDSTALDTANGLGDVGKYNNLSSLVVGVTLLLVGLMFTKKMGVVGSEAAGAALSGLRRAGATPFRWGASGVRKGMGLAWKVGKAPFVGGIKAGAGYLGQKYNETAPGWANPVAVYRGLKKRREEDKKDAQEQALARGRGVADRIMTFGKVRVPYEDALRRSQESAFAKDYSKMNKEQKAAALSRIWGKKGSEYEDRRRSLLMSMAVEGHIDDALSTDFFKEKYGDTIDQETVHSFLKDGCGTDQQGLRAAFDIGEAGKKINHYEYAGVAKYDIAKDEWAERKDPKESSDYAHSEINKMPTRDQLKMHPHNFSALRYDPALKTHVWAEGGDFEKGNWERIYGSMSDTQEIQRYTPARLADMFGKFDTSSRTFTVTDTMMSGIKHKWETNPLAVGAIFDKVGGQGVTYNGTTYDSFDKLATAQGWAARKGAPQPKAKAAAAGAAPAPGGVPPAAPAPGGAPPAAPPAPTPPTPAAPAAPVTIDTAALEQVINNLVGEMRNFSGKVNFDDLKRSMGDLKTGLGQAASEITRGSTTISDALGGAVSGFQVAVDKIGEYQRRMDEIGKKVGSRKKKT